LPALPSDYFATTPHLLGEWPGVRSKLSDLGISVSLTGVDEAVLNLSGGERRIAQEAGQVALQAEFDLQKSLGLQGTRFQVTLVDRWGRDAAADAGIPALQLLNEVYGRGNILRLERFAWDQKWFDDRIETTAGRMAFGDEFFTYPCDFINLTFCPGQAGNIAGDYIYNWPVSQWAAVARVNFGTEGYFKAGVFDSNSAYLDTTPNPASLPALSRRVPRRHFSRRNRLDAKIQRARGQLPAWRVVEQRRRSKCRDKHRWRADPGVGAARGSRSRMLRILHCVAAAARPCSGQPGPEEQRPERLSPRFLRGSPHIHHGLPDLRGNRAIRSRALEAEGWIWDCGRHDARQSEYRQRAESGQHPGRRPRLCSAQRIRNGSLVWLADDALAELETRRAIRDLSRRVYGAE